MGRRFLVAWLVLALLGAQALGMLHRVVHVPHAAAAVERHLHAAGAPHGEHADAGDGHERAGWLDQLFPHDDDSGCRLYDGVTHDGLPSLGSAVGVLPVPGTLLAWFAGECVARWAALYDARGPPALR